MMTLLQLVQAATGEMGIPTPTIVVGVNNTDTVQLLRLLNGLGRRLQREYLWQALCSAYRFNTEFLVATGTTTSGSAIVTGLSDTTGLDSTYAAIGTGMNQDTYVLTNDSASQVTLNQPATASGTVELTFCKTKYAMPSDYDRVQDDTQWDKTQHWRLIGPVTAQIWAWLQSGYISTGPRINFRQLGGQLQIWPALSTSHYLGLEYISNAWARSATGTPQSSLVADTDTCIYPDDLMITGLKVAYQKAKGLGDDYVDDYNAALSIAFGNDGGSAMLSMNPGQLNTLINWNNIPDSGYGQ